jgi:hypothetical protein
MRVVTTTIGQDEPFARTTATCASCQRQTPTLTWGPPPAASDKCAFCSRPIEPSSEFEVVDTDRFHRHCWMRLTSAESVRAAKALSRRSQELIRKSRELTGLRPLEDASEG